MVEQGARHHRQHRWIQSRVSLAILSHCMLLPHTHTHTVPVEARRNLSARVNNTRVGGACGRMKYKKRVRRGRHRLARQDHQTNK